MMGALVGARDRLIVSLKVLKYFVATGLQRDGKGSLVCGQNKTYNTN